MCDTPYSHGFVADKEERTKMEQQPKGANTVTEGHEAWLGTWSLVGAVVAALFAFIGLYLAIVQFLAPTTVYSLGLASIWYLGEVVLGVLFLIDTLRYSWLALRLSATNRFLGWLFTLYAIGCIGGFLTIFSEALLQKNMLLCSVMVLGLVVFWGIVNRLYFHYQNEKA